MCLVRMPGVKTEKETMKRLIYLLIFGISPVTFGAEYCVATNGNDAADGSIGSPFETLQHAVNQLASGDTLHVRGGRYREAVVVSGLLGNAGGSVWAGGSGWNGAWVTGSDTTSAQSGLNTAARMSRQGSITRTLAAGVSGGMLAFAWDADSLESSDTAYAEVYDGTWHTVWSISSSGNGIDSTGVPVPLDQGAGN